MPPNIKTNNATTEETIMTFSIKVKLPYSTDAYQTEEGCGDIETYGEAQEILGQLQEHDKSEGRTREYKVIERVKNRPRDVDLPLSVYVHGRIIRA